MAGLDGSIASNQRFPGLHYWDLGSRLQKLIHLLWPDRFLPSTGLSYVQPDPATVLNNRPTRFPRLIVAAVNDEIAAYIY